MTGCSQAPFDRTVSEWFLERSGYLEPVGVRYTCCAFLLPKVHMRSRQLQHTSCSMSSPLIAKP